MRTVSEPAVRRSGVGVFEAERREEVSWLAEIAQISRGLRSESPQSKRLRRHERTSQRSEANMLRLAAAHSFGAPIIGPLGWTFEPESLDRSEWTECTSAARAW